MWIFPHLQIVQKLKGVPEKIRAWFLRQDSKSKSSNCHWPHVWHNFLLLIVSERTSSDTVTWMYIKRKSITEKLSFEHLRQCLHFLVTGLIEIFQLVLRSLQIFRCFLQHYNYWCCLAFQINIRHKCSIITKIVYG